MKRLLFVLALFSFSVAGFSQTVRLGDTLVSGGFKYLTPPASTSVIYTDQFGAQKFFPSNPYQNFTLRNSGSQGFRLMYSPNDSTLIQRKLVVKSTSGTVGVDTTASNDSTIVVDLSASGGGSTLTGISLNLPGVIYNTPVNFTNSSGSWSATESLKAQSAHAFFGNNTGSTAIPGFFTLGKADLPAAIVYSDVAQAGHTFFGNNTGSSTTPNFFALGKADLPASVVHNDQANNFNGNTIENYSVKFNDQTGTTYTLLSSDNGKIITFNNASAITLTVPTGLPVGFNCTIVQKGAGQVTFTASSTTINNAHSYTKTYGQYAEASIICTTTNTFITGGDMQ